MANEILKDEILNDEHLDNVSGGDKGEIKALFDALKIDNADLLPERLKKEFGITLTYAKDRWEDPNTYTKDGKKLTHLEVMGIVRQKYPYKNIMDDILGTK